MKKVLLFLKQALFTRKEKLHSERYLKVVDFLNRYSNIFHLILACGIVFVVELVSRKDLVSAMEFIVKTPLTYLFNAFFIFTTLLLAYFFKRRAFARVIISAFWLLLGIINGIVLSNRVTPFGFADLKCIPDLLAMNNTSYFTSEQATAVVVGLVLFMLSCVVFYFKGPHFKGKTNKLSTALCLFAVMFVGIPVTTQFAQNHQIVDSYFANIAQGYKDSGFVYAFYSGVVDRGMKKPANYKEETIDSIMDAVANSKQETTTTAKNGPNIITVLLESFVDPEHYNFMEYSQDPTPFYHYLRDNFTSGYLNVPVIGAGTANTEFEVLTGMRLNYFGTGEYPYKTILKKTNCEGIAADLKSLGYATHAVHNNGGNFYSRVNAFSMMGFDSFTSKELMDITEITPNDSWAEDSILVQETIKTLLSTPNQPDFTYTITVGTHGGYPTTPVIENPYAQVLGLENEGLTNQWEYYMHQMNKTDQFIQNLITELEKLEEDTIVVFWGDHLPTMGLTEEDMVSGDIYKTSYVTWNNFGLEKEDTDLYAYQLMADILDSVGIHEGTMVNYHQTQAGVLEEKEYLAGIEQLQYDILYGKRYCYNGLDKYPATDIVMGIDDVVINDITLSEDGSEYIISGESFTQWSRVYINGEKFKPTYISGNELSLSVSKLAEGDSVIVSQVGSGNSRFRDSNEFIFSLVANTETEGTESTEMIGTEMNGTELSTETQTTETENEVPEVPAE